MVKIAILIPNIEVWGTSQVIGGKSEGFAMCHALVVTRREAKAAIARHPCKMAQSHLREVVVSRIACVMCRCCWL